MDIFEACKTGNLDWLKQQKSDGTLPSLMKTRQYHRCPHERAAAYGHLDVVRWLVEESGQFVDVTVDDDYTVRWAARNGHLDLVKWLVEASNQPVDITARDNTAVLWASESGHTAIVDYLNFVTPLIQAVGLEICRSVGFDAILEMLTSQATSKPTTRQL